MQTTEVRQPVKSTPQDVFLYLLATGALYFSAFSVITLLLQYVDILLPDPLKRYFEPGSGVRWSLAFLVVIFPVYLWVWRLVRRGIARDAAKAELKVRKWLLYLTLFLSTLLIIGTLVGLIFNFLQGELTAQFILKVVAVLIVAGAIFWYYLYEVRTKGARYDPRARAVVWVLIALVAAVAVSGLVLVGSPFRQRLIRFDKQKVGDLRNIQEQVIERWRLKGALPRTLDELKDDISGYTPPRDPQTGEAYEYRSTGDLSFELCAEFNTSSEETRTYPKPVDFPEPDRMESWQHDAGRECFSRTIDPDLYPRTEKPIPPIRIR